MPKTRVLIWSAACVAVIAIAIWWFYPHREALQFLKNVLREDNASFTTHMSLYSESSSATPNEIKTASEANIQQRLGLISAVRAHSDYIQPITLNAAISMLETENSVIRTRMRTVSEREDFLAAADELEQAKKGVAVNEKAAELGLRRGGPVAEPLAYTKHYLKQWKRFEILRNQTAKAYRQSAADFAADWKKLLSSRKQAQNFSVPLTDPSLDEASRFLTAEEKKALQNAH
jgi:hypothetical protein